MRRLPNPVRRSVDRFWSEPASIRNAALVMVAATVLIVLAGSAVIWVFDSSEYPSYGSAVWFTLQTVTTVGYGDVTPTSAVGRVVGGIVMVVAIAFITIVTALVTSTFIEAAQQRRRKDDQTRQRDTDQQLNDRLDEMSERLARIEEALTAAGSSDGGRDPER